MIQESHKYKVDPGISQVRLGMSKIELETETVQNRIKPNQIKPHQLKTEPNKNRTNNVVVVWFSKF